MRLNCYSDYTVRKLVSLGLNPQAASTRSTEPDDTAATQSACTGSCVGGRPKMSGDGTTPAPSNTHRGTVTIPLPHIGVDYVLIARNSGQIRNRKAPENINVFRGLFGCGGRI